MGRLLRIVQKLAHRIDGRFFVDRHLAGSLCT